MCGIGYIFGKINTYIGEEIIEHITYFHLISYYICAI